MKTNFVDVMFSEYQHLIKSAIRRNRPLFNALDIEGDDAEQDLSIAMLSAIEAFDPETTDSLETFISNRLDCAVQDMERQHTQHGVTGVPEGERLEVLSLDNVEPDSLTYELPDYDGEIGVVALRHKAEAFGRKMKGFSMRRNAQKASVYGVRGKLAVHYGDEGRVAA